MTVGGRHPYETTTKVNIASLENATDPVPECLRNPTNFVESVRGSVGGSLTSEGIPVVCGGFTTEDHALDQCYRSVVS